jgi:hypothetical protein
MALHLVCSLVPYQLAESPLAATSCLKEVLLLLRATASTETGISFLSQHRALTRAKDLSAMSLKSS